MKKIIMFLLIFFITITSIATSKEKLDYKNEMRELIFSIRERAGDKKTIITNGGVAIYFDDNYKINDKMFNTVDGVLVESVVYGYGGYNKKTPREQQANFLRFLTPLKEHGKEVILLDYVSNERGKQEVKKFLNENNFKGETPTSTGLNHIYNPTLKSKNSNIKTVKDAENILVLLNYEKFSNAEELVRILSYTNFDLLIIDPFIGKTILTKEQVEKIRTREDGTKRKVLAYMSIGEAETYRCYWNENWKVGSPKWLLEENENWENNYIVEYWNKDWVKIIKDTQREIDKSNFDGYFLDTIDSYQRF